MTHPLVLQLRFTRSEFLRSIKGVSEEDAQKRFKPMNCLSWNVGHLAWQEQRYFILYVQGKVLIPEINELFKYGAPASCPKLSVVLKAWRRITRETDQWLETVNTEILLQHVRKHGKPTPYTFGNLLQRLIYHYWYHIGENMGIRQNLKKTDLPEFVGNLDRQAPFLG